MELRKIKEEKLLETLEGYNRLVVETEDDPPRIIADITSDFIDIAEGYRARMRPTYS